MIPNSLRFYPPQIRSVPTPYAHSTVQVVTLMSSDGSSPVKGFATGNSLYPFMVPYPFRCIRLDNGGISFEESGVLAKERQGGKPNSSGALRRHWGSGLDMPPTGMGVANTWVVERERP